MDGARPAIAIQIVGDENVEKDDGHDQVDLGGRKPHTLHWHGERDGHLRDLRRHGPKASKRERNKEQDEKP